MASKAARRLRDGAHRARGALVATSLLLALGLGVQTQARAQEPQQAPGAASGSPAEALPVHGDRSTPRGSLFSYLVACRAGDFEQAATHLNLAPVPKRERTERGPQLARQLKLVLDQMLWVDLDAMSAEPTGHLDDGLPRQRDRVGVIDTLRGPVEIFVDRVRRDSVWVWEISPATVARIPALYEEFSYGALGDWLPAALFESHFLNVQLWQWMGLLLLVVLAYAVSWVVVRALLGVLGPLVARSDTEIDDRLVAALAGPLRLTVALVIFAVGVLSLGLAIPAQRFFVGLEKALGIVVATWFLIRLVDIFGGLVEARIEQRQPGAATALVPLGRKTLKAIIAALALLAGLDSLGLDVTALIAGLGVGGLAVALAAQKTLENLFGGATLIADRPVRVGDFCRYGDKIGIVEEIGLRSTRIRTLARTLVTIPNSEFSSLHLENFAARDKIWFNPRIGLRYETTPDQLRYVLVEIRKMLYSHPKVDPDPARVRFVGFGDFSLDIDIYAYVLATDFSEYLAIAEDLNLRMMDIVEESGTGFAFPSSTTYVARDDGVNEEKSRAAQRRVAKWRDQGELYLPGFTPEKISELAGTIEYPAKGSPDRKG